MALSSLHPALRDPVTTQIPETILMEQKMTNPHKQHQRFPAKKGLECMGINALRCELPGARTIHLPFPRMKACLVLPSPRFPSGEGTILGQLPCLRCGQPGLAYIDAGAIDPLDRQPEIISCTFCMYIISGHRPSRSFCRGLRAVY